MGTKWPYLSTYVCRSICTCIIVRGYEVALLVYLRVPFHMYVYSSQGGLGGGPKTSMFGGGLRNTMANKSTQPLCPRAALKEQNTEQTWSAVVQLPPLNWRTLSRILDHVTDSKCVSTAFTQQRPHNSVHTTAFTQQRSHNSVHTTGCRYANPCLDIHNKVLYCKHRSRQMCCHVQLNVVLRTHISSNVLLCTTSWCTTVLSQVLLCTTSWCTTVLSQVLLCTTNCLLLTHFLSCTSGCCTENTLPLMCNRVLYCQHTSCHVQWGVVLSTHFLSCTTGCCTDNTLHVIHNVVLYC